MNRLFEEARWSLEFLAPPWADALSIYDHIRSLRNGPLPDELSVAEKNQLKWSDGASDGVLGHHWRGTDDPQRVPEILLALRSLLDRADGKTLNAVYGWSRGNQFCPL